MTIKKNKLKVIDNDGTIHLDWEVNQRSNTEDEWLDSLDDTEELWFSNDEAIFDIFDLGLVIQTLVRNIEEKTPNEYKKYFYNEETLITEDPKTPLYDRYLGRLKIFERNAWEEEQELLRKARHMADFYALWREQSLGRWKFEILNKQKNSYEMFPLQIIFEWTYPDFFIFDRFVPWGEYEDLFHLCSAVWEESMVDSNNKFLYLVESDVKYYEREV